MELVDGSGRSAEEQCGVAGDLDNDIGGKHTRQVGEGNQLAGSVRFWQEGVDAVRQIKQRMGQSLPEGAQRIKCEAVSSGGSDVFWGGAVVSDGIGDGAVYSAESRMGEEGSGDGMRCVRGEFGKSHATWSGMDISS